MSLAPVGNTLAVKHSITNCRRSNTEKVCSISTLILCDSCHCYDALGASPCPMFVNGSLECMLDRIEVVR